LFFRLLYHELAWTYDLVAWAVSFGQWKAWGRAAIPRLRGPRVLDMAHGPGHLLVAMTRAGLSPVGLDLSPQMGRLAQARLRAPSPSPGEGRGEGEPLLVRAQAQALPFRSGSFDSVVSTFPAEFIMRAETLNEIARVIKDAGGAVVVPGVAFKRNLPARLLEWLYTVTGQQEPALPKLADALAEAGLAIEIEREPLGYVDVLIVVARKRLRPDPGAASESAGG
jgi:ubiquinone/menaquinone biosynthesis C-methylase UbiE